jgi:hypothetical protein
MNMKFQLVLIAWSVVLSVPNVKAGEFVDGDNEPPYQVNGMHTCPGTFAVTGVHVNRNLLLCTGSFEYLLDPVRQSWGMTPTNQYDFDNTSMHWCGENSFVIGVHVDGNGFNCQSFDAITTNQMGQLGAPFLDRGEATARNGMHACPIGSVLVGAHFSSNTFLCAQLPLCADNAQCASGQCRGRTPRSLLKTCQ